MRTCKSLVSKLLSLLREIWTIVQILLLTIVLSLSVTGIEVYFNVSVDVAVGILWTVATLFGIMYCVPKFLTVFKSVNSKTPKLFFISVFCVLGPISSLLIGVLLTIHNL